MPMPLVILESPYRETVRPVLRYVRGLLRDHPGDVVAVVIPEYVVAHWWEHLLHNQTAWRLKARLLYEPSVTVTSVPFLLGRPAHRDEHQRENRDRASPRAPRRAAPVRAIRRAAAEPRAAG